MKYKTILSKEECVLPLMRSLELLRIVLEARKISHHPDYDHSPYKGPVTQTYLFKDTQSIPYDLFSAYGVEIVETRIFHQGDIHALIEQLGVDAEVSDDPEWILTQAVADSETFPPDHGYDALSQFTLRKLEVLEIDNAARRIELQGTFEGDSYAISQADWALYALIRFTGFKDNMNEAEFYLQLLVESYQLRSKGDHRVSFFLAYAAVESFINRKLNSENENGRLSEKGRELFLREFAGVELAKHEIYTNVASDFNNQLTRERNGIAHGRLAEIGAEQSRHMLLVALLFICSIELHTDKFAQLFPPSR